MATDDIVARLRDAGHIVKKSISPFGKPGDMTAYQASLACFEAATALTDRDAQIERLKSELEDERAEVKRLSGDPPADWGEVATMLAEQVMLQLGRAPEASRDPGIDPRRDRICALIESALNARATTAERERDELKFLYANALRNSKFSSDAMDRKLSEVERERDEARAEVERKDAALRLCVARDPCLHIHPAVRAALTAKGGENADS